MANDRPGDWRHPAAGGKPATPRPDAPRTSRRAWQPGGPAADTPGRRSGSRGKRLALAGVVTLALVAAAVWVIWLFWPARYPQLAAVAPSLPAESLALPLDVAGSNAAAELIAWAGEGRDRDRPRPETAAVVTVGADGAKVTIDADAKNLVLYFAAPGGADADGAYLWVAPPDARAAAGAHKLHVRDIIDRASARRGKPTLIVFDCTRVSASWPHGLIFNDFARALKNLDPQIADIPGLAVICASDDDQRSWVFEERRTSTFGFYFLESLKGAGRGPGERVTAAAAFDQAKGEVERWAVANRNEKQTPILLPAAEGRARAERIDLSAAPASGHVAPPGVEPPANVPPELEEAWKIADLIAAQAVPPEANSQAQWREYLDLLLRWEYQFRLRSNPDATRDRVAVLATQLRNPAAGRELAAVPVAFPAGRALGRPPEFPDPKAADAFRFEFDSKVWEAPNAAERTTAWEALLRKHAGRESAVRAAAAARVLARLLDAPTPDQLKIASDVLKLTHGDAGLPLPAEAHFVRMLQLFLDANRPDAALLRRALKLRATAEEAAWVFFAEANQHPYAESVFPWVRGQIEAADRNRQLGQDLLFSAEAKDWKRAEEYLEKAEAEYQRAAGEGRKVAAALGARDRVFARLPYYARWLASYRGNRPATEIDRLLDRAVTAFERAHAIGKMTTEEPKPEHVAELDKLRADADLQFEAIQVAFAADVAALNNNPQPSNWHAIDSALAVPFITARRRIELLSNLRYISHQLEANRQQLDGSKVPPPQARESAARHGRVALALLGDTSVDHRQLLDRPDPAGWWISFRTVGDKIGTQFRSLATGAKDAASEAARAPDLRKVGPQLAVAALKSRVADPAAPVAGDAVASDLRFRRHGFLLWQAARVTTEGWADVVYSPSPDGWYCRKTSALLVASAEALIRETASELVGRPVESMSPAELDRWLPDCRAEAARRPVVLKTTPNGEREIADDPFFDFTFQILADAKDRPAVGYPVSWVQAPGKPYPQPAPNTTGRRVEPDFVLGRDESRRPLRFTAAGAPKDVAASGKLLTTALYRGHPYTTETAVTLVGTPTREWFYSPPTGPATFAVRAGRGDVAGAVTILVDLTRSMNIALDAKDPTSPTRLREAKKGLEAILDLPEMKGAKVTLVTFYGDGARGVNTVERLGKSVVLDGTNAGDVFKQIRDVQADGGSTPLAGAIREVLDKDDAKKFWPENFTGSRTLIVLTDGEDNWGETVTANGTKLPNVYKGQQEPGRVALEALRGTADDVNLHVVFFGLTSTDAKKEEERAVKQFEALRDPTNFRSEKPGAPSKTPAQLWTKIHDSTALADLVRRAMLPQFAFAERRGLASRIEATIPEEGVMRTNPALPAGLYDFWGLRGKQALQLRPADRVLVQARREGDRFELYLPTYGFEVADKLGRPRNSTGTAATGGIRGTLPRLELDNGSIHADLLATMTLEPIADRKAAEQMEVIRPQFAWFDADYADGKPAEKGLNPAVRIENKWPLWAPAWNLTVSRWAPAGADPKTVRHPNFTGYWLDGFPRASASYPVNLNDLPGSLERLEKFRVVRVRDNDVRLLDVAVEPYSAPGLPEGKYLTVRMKYGKPGEYVFLRAGNLKGPDQPYLLHERHVYYDAQSRYTARFGPLLDADAKDVTLDLHAVADLKEASAKASRSVSVRPTEDKPLPTLRLPPELEILPRKE